MRQATFLGGADIPGQVEEARKGLGLDGTAQGAGGGGARLARVPPDHQPRGECDETLLCAGRVAYVALLVMTEQQSAQC